jgi:PAS domain S-box-containing protein
MRMKLAQEGARIVTWEWNLVSDEVTYSPNVEAVYGWPVRRNEDFWAHIHAEDARHMQGMYAQAVAQGTGCECDFRITRPDGSQRWIASRATVLQDSVGRPVKMVGISMDNTERKVAEEHRARARNAFARSSNWPGGIGLYRPGRHLATGQWRPLRIAGLQRGRAVCHDLPAVDPPRRPAGQPRAARTHAGRRNRAL